MSPTPENQQLNAIQDGISEIKAALASERSFSILDVLRDEVSGLSHQLESVRDDIRDLRNLMSQQSQPAD
ncbi:hypothetical protein RE428_33460 [Marinobacter nanhaiticus D15-8W]|uniref:Uncharacterized protein n=1 Tax=Marinobacter nanhaiticus D15-8W TaxID=626887 RepID=N6WZE5_9GAMM|nr:hypothetical protein [Marinobacter nanhaiticus]ENO16537.1 hypothetical protein J057_02465 [Marinobacter nanhaiticus D15-8W]BES72328.1 hypothetical protein RE428_33460 [Marinobacter nanhaiticus D15-8W]